MRRHHLILLLLLSVTFTFAQQVESDFYNPDLNATASVIIDDLTGAENGNDSGTLNAAITELSNRTTNGKKGGTITILPNASITTIYLKNIDLLSNVHLKIDPSITLIPQTVGARVFYMGENEFAENVALTSNVENSENKNEAFKVQLRAEINDNESVLKLGYVQNFKVSGIDVQDKQTKISAITMSIGKAYDTDKTKTPFMGVMKNLWVYDAHVGYGLIQAQSARMVLFKNMHGTGGITLRFESGNNQHIVSTDRSVDNVYAENISITKGDAALNMSPHRSNQGSVHAVGIKAYNSGWAVQAAAGFIGQEGADPPFANNKGSYESVTVVIEEIVGGFGAQVKSKDFSFFSCNQTRFDSLQTAFTDEVKLSTSCVITNSIGAARINATIDCSGLASDGCYDIDITYPSEANTSGFFQLEPIGYGKTTPSCDVTVDPDPVLSVGDDDIMNLYPNPAQDWININCQLGSTFNITNIQGQILFKGNGGPSVQSINVSNLAPGLYLVNFSGRNRELSTEKLVIQ